MRKGGYAFVLLFLVALVLHMPGLMFREAAAAGDEKAAPQEGENGAQAAVGETGKAETDQDGCPGTFGPIITDTAIPIEKGRFAIQPTFGFSFVTKTFNKDWRRVSSGGSFRNFTMNYKITMGLWNNLEGFVVIPFQANWVNNAVESGPNGERSTSQGGLGDLNLTLKYRFVEEGRKMPNITALFATDFPTGRFRGLNPSKLGMEAMGGGAYVFTGGLNMSKYLRPFTFYGNLWYSMQTAYNDDERRVYPRDFVTVNLAAEYPLAKKWVALLELTSFWDAGRLFGHKANTPPGALLSILPGIEYMATKRFSLAFGVNVDLAGKNTYATVTPTLSMVYAF